MKFLIRQESASRPFPHLILGLSVRFCPLLILTLAIGTADSQPVHRTRPLVVRFSTPTATTVIENNKITNSYQTEEKYSNPASSIPESFKIVTRSAEITAAQRDRLEKLIQSVNFWNLPEFSGAPPNERYYPYSITVTQNGRSKTVLHRSNPSFPPAPSGFRRLEAHLNELLSSIHSWESKNQ